MEALATKLAPIMAKKSGEHRKGGGGGGDNTNASSGSFALSTLGLNPVSSFQGTEGDTMSPKDGGNAGGLQLSPRQLTNINSRDVFALSANQNASGGGFLGDNLSGDLLAFSALSNHQHQHTPNHPQNNPNALRDSGIAPPSAAAEIH